MPNSQGKARHLWCGWSEWLRMVGKNQEPGPSLWLSNRCFIQIYHNIFDWLKRSSAPMKTCWNMLKPVETANMCISSINTQSIYKQSLKTTTVHVWPMSGNDHVRVSQARLRLCDNFGFEMFERKFAQYFTHDPQSAASPECALGYGRKQEFIWCQHLCIRVFRVATSSQPNPAPIHLEHLGTSWNWTSDPFWVLRSPGVEPCLKVSAQCIKRRSHRML